MNIEEQQLIGQREAEISTQEEKIAQQRQRLNEQEEQVNAITLPQRSLGFQFSTIRNNRQMAGRTEEIIQQRKQIKEQGLQQIQQARGELSSYETNVLLPAKQQIADIRGEESAYQTAQSLVASEAPIPVNQLQPRVKYYFEEITKGKTAEALNLESEKQLATLKSQGITPVYSAGNLTGFTDVNKGGVSVPLANINTYLGTSTSPATTATYTNIDKQFQPATVSFVKSGQDLNTNTSNSSNGFGIQSGLFSGLSNRLVSGMAGEQYINNSSGSFLSGLLSGANKGYKENKETYNPNFGPVGAYTKSSETAGPSGLGGTLSARSPTLAEMQTIQAVNARNENINNWIKENILFQNIKPVEQQVFQLNSLSSNYPKMQTSTYGVTPESQLSEEALAFKRALPFEIGLRVAEENRQNEYRANLQYQVNTGALSVEQANLNLIEFSNKANIEESNILESKQRVIEKGIQKERHPITFSINQFTNNLLPEWNPKYKEGKGALVNIENLGIGISKGVYSNVRSPATLIKEGAILGATTLATGGLGDVAIVAGYGKYVSKIGTAFKVATYGGLGLYGAGKYGQFSSAQTYGERGEIIGGTAVEAGAFYLGYKVPETAIYRYQSQKYLKGFESLLKEKGEIQAFNQATGKTETLRYEDYVQAKTLAQSLSGVQKEPGPLDFSRLEFLEGNKKAQDFTYNFFLERKGGGVLGGSITQGPQLEKTSITGETIQTKRPGDIDYYTKGYIGNIGEEQRGVSYANQYAKGLTEAGVKNVRAEEGTVYQGNEKIAEFHPLSKYLKFNLQQILPIYKSYKSQIVKSEEGVSILGLSAQAQRKAIGYYLEPLMSGKFRAKDLPAFNAITESLFQTSAKQLKEKGVVIELVKNIPSQNNLEVLGQTQSSENVFGAIIGKSRRLIGLSENRFLSRAESIIGTTIPRKILIKENQPDLAGTTKHELLHALKPGLTEGEVRASLGQSYPKAIKASYENPELYSKNMVDNKVTPIERATYLKNKGKIIFEELTAEQWKSIPGGAGNTGIFGRVEKGSFKNAPEVEGTIFVRKDLSPEQKQIRVAHELIHYDNPQFDKIDMGIKDYYKKPGEIFAMQNEKKFAREGFSITNDFAIQKGLNTQESTSNRALTIGGVVNEGKGSSANIYQGFNKPKTISIYPKKAQTKSGTYLPSLINKPSESYQPSKSGTSSYIPNRTISNPIIPINNKPFSTYKPNAPYQPIIPFSPIITTTTKTNNKKKQEEYGRLGIDLQGKTKKKKGKAFIKQPLAYEPSLGSSVFNIKFKGSKVPKSGNIGIGERRKTFGIKQLRKINKGVSIF